MTFATSQRLFPLTRMRRMRADDFSRRMMRENQLTTDDLIYPMFVIPGQGQTEQGVVANGLGFVWACDPDGTGLLDDFCVGRDGSPGDEVGGPLLEQVPVKLVVDGKFPLDDQEFPLALWQSEEFGFEFPDADIQRFGF